jgi:predicted site-specific integrase-resolvase
MKLSQWAREQGLTYKGAWRMWRAGQLPVPAEPLPTGTIMVKEIKTPAHAVALYARVSSSDQRKDWEAQLGRLVVYAHNHRLTIVQALSEVGSGLNGRRRKLIKLLANPKIQTIVVEHRDRLAIVKRAVQNSPLVAAIESFDCVPGRGVIAVANGTEIVAGSRMLLKRSGSGSARSRRRAWRV